MYILQLQGPNISGKMSYHERISMNMREMRLRGYLNFGIWDDMIVLETELALERTYQQ